MKQTIRLRGLNSKFKGRVWESTSLLRVGRLDPLEIVLDDSSVSRYHAEVRATDHGWRVRDLGSTNGTRLNGVRVGQGLWPLRVRDLIQFGEVTVVVEAILDESSNDPQEPPSSDHLQVEATTNSTWAEALEGIALDASRQGKAGEQLLALLRASHNLVNLEREEDLLHTILDDAVAVLDAQRGAIALLEGPGNSLKLRALVSGRGERGRGELGVAGSRPGEGIGVRFQFSHSIANRCVTQGESILCHKVEEDPELAAAQSIAEGAMGSVLCVLLRTPRKRIGILHLDRSPLQKPFTREDLRLADGLAANVSAGIECAQLLKKQRDLFLNTITILAQAVEMRDEYTGGHTLRVTNYSLMLAEHLNFAPKDVDLIRIGTPLHDIGKIGIDDAILRKPERLTPEEFEIMKTHTIKGAEILSTIPDLQTIIPIVRHHHERYDGKGYPDGLAGEDISPLARVVALADAFDAMTSDRPYRKGMPATVAFAEIEKMAGSQFDPNFAAGFLAIREKLVADMRTNTSAVSPSHRTRSLVPVVRM